MIATGDFNTPVENVKMVFDVVSKAPYPTYDNPKSQAANYDQVVIIPKEGSEHSEILKKYEMLSEEHLSAASQQLITSITKNREKYLGMV